MSHSEKFFDKVASKPKDKLGRSALKLVELSKAYLDQEQVVLDFGCGSGLITNEIARYVGIIDGVDHSSNMLAYARSHAKERSINNVNYLQASTLDKHFKEESIDIVFAFNVLHYVEDIKGLMAQINKVLKPDGLFISSTVCFKEKKSLLSHLLFLLGKSGLIPKMKFFKRSELEFFMQQYGFDVFRSEQISGLPEYFIVAGKRTLFQD